MNRHSQPDDTSLSVLLIVHIYTKHLLPWHIKYSNRQMCAAKNNLRQSIASVTTTTKVAKCLKYCANHPKTWAVKCAWATKDCSACPECTRKCFCAASVRGRIFTIALMFELLANPFNSSVIYVHATTYLLKERWVCNRVRF